jgi:hypothetical protein
LSAAVRHIVVVFLLILSAPHLKAQQVSEYQVKAAFLFNFSKFLEWPPEAMGQPNEPFVVGVIGNDPFGNYLDEIISGEKIMDHPMIVKRYNSIDEIDKCHILFINMPGKTRDVLNTLKGKSILTVSDEEDFNGKGGIIKFYTDNDMIRLQINIDAAKAANLNVSSKLLRIARIYE